jgi:hypothetical protein
VYAQAQQEWASRFTTAGNGDDAAAAVALDPSGNVYVTGQAVGTGLDYATVKYDPSGVQQWVRTYNGPGNADDVARAIATDAAGNVYVTGFSVGSGGAQEDYATIKYDTDGNQLWLARYNGPADNWDEALDVAVDDEGNVIVTGRSSHMGGWFDFDYATVKYDALGVQQWVTRYNGNGNDWDQANSVAVDRFGEVYVTGTAARETGTAYNDYVTIKYTATGALKWTAVLDGAGQNWDEAVAIAVDEDGFAYVAGYTMGSVYDFLTVKYTPAGNVEWSRVWTGAGATADVAKALAIDAAGNVFITGSSALNYATVKYDSAGVEQWVRLYGGAAEDIPYAIAPDVSGDVYVTGGSSNSIATVKYDRDGTEEWVALYNGPGPGQDVGNGMVVDGVGNVVVVGRSWGVMTGPDFATIKYSQPTAAIDAWGASALGHLANAPNPFGGTTTISFAVPGSVERSVRLGIYDPAGREVARLVDGTLAPGSYHLAWDAAGHPAGAYFYRLSADGISRTRKMVRVP